MLTRTDYGGKEADVVRALEEDIIFGRLAPGARLVEDGLLARFPVSRHSIRQALYQLEKLGIVTRERNKGAMVRRLSSEEVRQIYEVRELLQRQAALMIPLPASAALIDELMEIHSIYSAHVDANYLRGIHEANDRFHLTMFSACGNAYLVSSIEQYMRLSLPVRANSLADREKLEVSRQHHCFMIEALKRRDNWVLAQLCIDHLQPSKAFYLQEIGKSEEV
ncbi:MULTISPECIES: GntR family transcriptional regulator [unclassified Mesorhizobium]|uniref:GntR family transcriptional regulator n=1 Tax=unclassified Mesorhizobium TaxID=325217 RepID=UPI000BAE8163|nr:MULTISPECIES: GntR family transcriptional regulator [unclassified Mesorhizobium]TGT56854.1 GntR family transcriptional regulator [Mesorhizobium sp. M00.F.Ca.ET.170.01.1.1]AZO08621.1 GntR family transcriptional regulator [Mesorhizobium sp. M3A.F.Ca.ET.080.04.2.1]PBB85502.1 GntR family transcriptional regulator [Mesorhizobium sp. WSM3876]RWB71738.1 MAG: GntR family transcriptional regulator [Mesorhizobium sp.]RWB85010.1 MAG: GntR family transcriptional regulator [Mesorhizobium sp.]